MLMYDILSQINWFDNADYPLAVMVVIALAVTGVVYLFASLNEQFKEMNR